MEETLEGQCDIFHCCESILFLNTDIWIGPGFVLKLHNSIFINLVSFTAGLLNSSATNLILVTSELDVCSAAWTPGALTGKLSAGKGQKVSIAPAS